MRTQGFWRGVLAGAAVAVAIALGLTMAFPPMVLRSPAIAPGAQLSPAAPASPGSPAQPGAPQVGSSLLRPAAAPLIADRPAADTPPDAHGLAPPSAPAVFDGGPAGSPSLVPPQG